MKKIKKMKVEEDVLTDLIKKTQIERYKNNKISELVYNIRIKHYKQKLQEINQELPVLESRLRQEKRKDKK